MLASIFTGLVGRLIIFGAIALAALGALTAYSVSLYNKGWYAHETQIKQQNDAALERADKAAQRFRDCIADDSMRWNATTGECEGR